MKYYVVKRYYNSKSDGNIVFISIIEQEAHDFIDSFTYRLEWFYQTANVTVIANFDVM